MKAWQIPQFGLNHLQRVELPPQPLQENEVRVAIRAASLNYRDYLVVEGSYNPKQMLPLVPGSDASGQVIEVGSAVTRCRVGDRVCPIFSQNWLSGPPTRENMRATLGSPLTGTLREEGVFEQEGLVAIPDYLDWSQAATLPCAAVTAWNALKGLTPGSRVLLIGTGGVSIFALQFAKAMQLQVAILSSSDVKLERARALGADFTLNYKATPAWSRELRQWSGSGLDCVVEVGGAGTLEQSIASLKPGGQISLIGVLSGSRAPFNVLPILMQQLRIQGILVGNRDDFEAMNLFLQQQQLQPVVDSQFPFEQLPQALRQLASGAHLGKIVVTVPS
jgi:NADPH:quinone reductase-like Zn-dependent oxidoreductase